MADRLRNPGKNISQAFRPIKKPASRGLMAGNVVENERLSGFFKAITEE